MLYMVSSELPYTVHPLSHIMLGKLLS